MFFTQVFLFPIYSSTQSLQDSGFCTRLAPRQVASWSSSRASRPHACLWATLVQAAEAAVADHCSTHKAAASYAPGFACPELYLLVAVISAT